MFLQKPTLGTQLNRSDSLNNPVLDLLMNEGHGDRVNDLSGNGNNGTLHGFDFPPTVASGWNPGMDGIALNFDGIDDYIDCGNDASLDVALGDFSVEIVFKTPVSLQGLMDKIAYGWYSYFSGGKLLIGFVADAGAISVVSSIVVTDDEWHRAILNVESDVASIHIDGVQRSGNTDISGYRATNPNSTLHIGYMAYGYLVDDNNYFKGSIARARILPRCMSAFEVMRTQINPYGVYLQ